jgi:colanic acid biosynthesis glycosyl transferase WcaI
MACAKPVVLMVDGEAKRLLERSGGGVHVDPGNGPALAEAITSLADQAEQRAEMGARGRAFVLGAFVRDDQAAKLERLLVELD